ncbi:MAG TPA: heavy metal-associated domain-containing protein [Ignavibacteriales bacterium]|nr:heavy metal-associated domain-containing protein [Ignavibacteriales bacterium]HPP32842.1 heavy metal-associated domain-containing protein [Ignavibacteriales bacterium]
MVEVKKLKIEGITCAMCVKSIEKRLQKLEGIESYSVNIIDNTALIKYNDKQIKIDDIITEIEKLGYKVIYYKEKSKKEIKKLYYSFLGIFLSLLMMISMNNHSLHHSLKYIYPIITIL